MTAPDGKRQGLARLTLQSAISALSDSGATSLHLVVTEGNEPAQALYRGLGFRPL